MQAKTSNDHDVTSVVQAEEQTSEKEAGREKLLSLAPTTAMLNSGRLLGAQRQALVQQVGRQYGNRQVQRMVSEIRRSAATPEQAPAEEAAMTQEASPAYAVDTSADNTGGSAARSVVQRGFFDTIGGLLGGGGGSPGGGGLGGMLGGLTSGIGNIASGQGGAAGAVSGIGGMLGSTLGGLGGMVGGPAGGMMGGIGNMAGGLGQGIGG